MPASRSPICASPVSSSPGKQDHGKPAAHRLGARHHAGRPDRRGGLQQRVRASQSGRLFPHLSSRAFRGRTARPSCAAITSPSCWPAGSATSAPNMSPSSRFRAGHAAGRAGRSGDADRARRRRGLQHGVAAVQREDLDFASVQRGNPEMQRRCQEVIDRCWALGERQSHPLHPRRGRRRSVQCAARAGA